MILRTLSPGKISLIILAFIIITSSSSGQDTSSVFKVKDGIPVGFTKLPAPKIEAELSKKALKLAANNKYKAKNEWGDTIRFWRNSRDIFAVSFINFNYEQTVVIFNSDGQWLQTTSCLNPEFQESSRILTTAADSGLTATDMSSPIGQIIKYSIPAITWYEAEVYKNESPSVKYRMTLDKNFRLKSLQPE